MPRKIEMIGRVFTRMTVIAEAGEKRRGHSIFLCRCDCGIEKNVNGSELRRGNVQSCGCLAKERSAERNKTHGMTNTRIFKTWSGMISRCKYPSDPHYPRYGGRGIIVCDRWLSFENFFADMGEPPSHEHTLDREKNNENYTPENCRWATRVEQARNMSTNRQLTFRGETKCVSEWAEIVDLPVGTIFDRLRRGWTPEQSLTTPRKQTKLKNNTEDLTYQGQTKSKQEWAKEVGISYSTLLTRLLRGWSVERALSTLLR